MTFDPQANDLNMGSQGIQLGDMDLTICLCSLPQGVPYNKYIPEK
jgi:hypothetical protein